MQKVKSNSTCTKDTSLLHQKPRIKKESLGMDNPRLSSLKSLVLVKLADICVAVGKIVRFYISLTSFDEHAFFIPKILLVGKPHPFRFYSYGFNVGIVATLFSTLFGKLLGSKRCKWAAGLN
jgi:hypothetical protein